MQIENNGVDSPAEEVRPALRGSRPRVTRSRTPTVNNLALPIRRSERLKRKADRDALQSLTNQHPESSSQSNNVETLQRCRNKNFRLQVPSSESPRHSKEPDRGAPGRAAASNLTSASGYWGAEHRPVWLWFPTCHRYTPRLYRSITHSIQKIVSKAGWLWSVCEFPPLKSVFWFFGNEFDDESVPEPFVILTQIRISIWFKLTTSPSGILSTGSDRGTFRLACWYRYHLSAPEYTVQ